MKGCDGPSLDAGDKDSIGIVLMVLHEVAWCLLGGYRDQWHTLVRWLEPYNLGFLWLTLLIVTSSVTVSLLPLRFLLLLGCLATGPQET